MENLTNYFMSMTSLQLVIVCIGIILLTTSWKVEREDKKKQSQKKRLEHEKRTNPEYYIITEDEVKKHYKDPYYWRGTFSEPGFCGKKDWSFYLKHRTRHPNINTRYGVWSMLEIVSKEEFLKAAPLQDVQKYYKKFEEWSTK